MSDLSEESYERVAALRNSYRQRLAVTDQVDSINPSFEGEILRMISEEEARHRCSIERAETASVSSLMERWNRRGSAIGFEFAVIKERKDKRAEADRKLFGLRKELYREQFLNFWRDVKKQQLVPHDTEVTKLLTSAYRYNMVPFATDPVECWEKGIVVPPELQRNIELRDRHGAVSLPPFHELSMKFREAYDRYRAEKTGVMLPHKYTVSECSNWDA